MSRGQQLEWERNFPGSERWVNTESYWMIAKQKRSQAGLVTLVLFMIIDHWHMYSKITEKAEVQMEEPDLRTLSSFSAFK